jgi:hypothetical protein
MQRPAHSVQVGGQLAIVRRGTDGDGAALRVDPKVRIDVAQVNKFAR